MQRSMSLQSGRAQNGLPQSPCTEPAHKPEVWGPPLPFLFQAAPQPAPPSLFHRSEGDTQRRPQSLVSKEAITQGDRVETGQMPQSTGHSPGIRPPYPPYRYEIETDHLIALTRSGFCLPPCIVQRTTFQWTRLEDSVKENPTSDEGNLVSTSLSPQRLSVVRS